MHTPMTVEQLINRLNTIKNKNKEILINLGFNDYDIITIDERKKEVTLLSKHISKRNDPDENKVQ